MQEKRRVCFIGGLERAGKSTIVEEIMKKKSLIVINTDALRSGIRNVLVGRPPGNIGAITFKSTATYQIPGNEEVFEMQFSRENQGEDDLAWLALVGIIGYYDSFNKHDLLIEGVAVKLEKVNQIVTRNLELKAAFVGYSNESHAKSISDYSKKEKDYIYWQLNGDSQRIEQYALNLVRGKLKENEDIKNGAEKLGYGYFDITKRSFEEHISAVINHFLK